MLPSIENHHHNILRSIACQIFFATKCPTPKYAYLDKSLLQQAEDMTKKGSKIPEVAFQLSQFS
jgi:hypothetical protein